VPIHGVCQSGLLDLGSILEQFLDYVIPENILDELESVSRNDLIEDNLLLIAGGRLELLLNETRAVLISTELDDVSKDIPQLPLPGLVRAEILQEGAPEGSRFIPPSCTHTLGEPMRTVQPVHPGDKETNRGVIVQGITLGMRRWC